MRRISSITITPSGQWFFGGAVAISLLLHAIVVGALIGGWERQLAETEETPIFVELVPPPEPEAPEPKPQPQGQPSPEEEPAALQSTLPVLQPVIEFAEKDSAPRVERDGRSEQQSNKPEPDEPEQTESKLDEADEAKTSDTGRSQILREQAAQTSKEQPQEIPEPEPEPGQVADAETTPDEPGTAGSTISLITPTPRPVQNPVSETGEPGATTETPQLSNEAVLDDPRILTAMAGMPRSQRINLLCMTVMRNQLETARPPRPPQYLPAFDLPAGNVLHPPEAAFLSQGKWFELEFRCEVDDGATKVQKFNYQIGEAIPRSQWSQRGFPSF